MSKQEGHDLPSAVSYIFADLFQDEFAMHANVPGRCGNQKDKKKIVFGSSKIFKLMQSKLICKDTIHQ